MVTQEFIKAHSLDVGPPGQPGRWYSVDKWVWGTVLLALGYVIFRDQVEQVKGYNKDQVALVTPDTTTFGSRVLVTLGTPTDNQIMNIIKESEIENCLSHWMD